MAWPPMEKVCRVQQAGGATRVELPLVQVAK